MALVATYIAGAHASGNASTYNLGNFNAGAGGLMVVLAEFMYTLPSTSISSIDIGGSAGSIVANSASSNAAYVAVATQVVGSGNQNVTVNFGSALQGTVSGRVSVWVLTGYLSATPFATNTAIASANANSQSITLNTPLNGVALFLHGHNNTSDPITWSSATENTLDNTGGFRHSEATLFPTSSQTPHTETASWTTNALKRNFVAASWAPLVNTDDNADAGSIAITGETATETIVYTSTGANASLAYTGKNATETFTEVVAVGTITFTGEVATQAIVIFEDATEGFIDYSGQIATDDITFFETVTSATLTYTGEAVVEDISEIAVVASVTFTGSEDADELTGYLDFADDEVAVITYSANIATEFTDAPGTPTAQMTQQSVLVLAEGAPKARVTQQTVLVLAEGDNRARVTQVAVLVLARVNSAALNANEATQIITLF